MDASENSTTKVKKFEMNRWYRFRVRVTPAKLEAWIDDEQVIDVEITGRKVGMRIGEIESSQPLGIATFRTKAALREIKLRKLWILKRIGKLDAAWSSPMYSAPA